MHTDAIHYARFVHLFFLGSCKVCKHIMLDNSLKYIFKQAHIIDHDEDYNHVQGHLGPDDPT